MIEALEAYFVKRLNSDSPYWGIAVFIYERKPASLVVVSIPYHSESDDVILHIVAF